MAIGTPVLAVANPTGGTTSVTTASFTPTANSTLIALVGSKATTPTRPTISDSLGGTWTLITTGHADNTATSPNIESDLYYQTVGASPASMTVTASGGTTTTILSVISVTGISTDFSNVAVGTSATGAPSATLTNVPASTSAVLAWYEAHLTNAVTQPTGFTELYDSTLASNYRAEFSYKLPTSPPQSGSWSGGTNTTSVGILLEVKDASAGTNTYTYSGSGGIQTGGAASLAKIKAFSPSGGITTGGSASLAKLKVFTPSGGIQTGGAATTSFAGNGSVTHSYVGTGGITLAGSAGASFVGVTTQITGGCVSSSGRPFDGRLFDMGLFDCNCPVVTVTLGGWTPETKATPKWGPNDLARGTQWNSKAKGQSTW